MKIFLRKRIISIFTFLLILIILSSCGLSETSVLSKTSYSGTQTDPQAAMISDQLTEENETTSSESSPSTEDDFLHQQMLLYLQKGLKDYEITKTLSVYVIEPKEEGIWEAYLFDTENIWKENIFYEFDDEKNWYFIQESYEPVFTNDDTWASVANDTEREAIKKEAIYQTELSADSILPWSIRYTGPEGPTTIEHYKTSGHFHSFSAYLSLESWCYVFEDVRQKIHIFIEYPQLSYHYSDSMTEELCEKINQTIHHAFFYDYFEDDQEMNSLHMQNYYIERCYLVTKKEEEILSIRIYDESYRRGCNHPNEGETGLTINCNTGEIVKLEEILKADLSIKELIDANLFHCLWVWRDTPYQDAAELEQEYLSRISPYYNLTVADFDNRNFYLTEDSLGLITSNGRYYTCIEASLEDLKEKGYLVSP